MGCGCKGMRSKLRSQLAQGRITEAVGTAVEGLKMMVGAAPNVPPPEIIRGDEQRPGVDAPNVRRYDRA